VRTLNFLSLLQRLRKRQIDLIVVGGVAGVSQGAPITTFDLDVVHSRDPQNVNRLLAALEELGAYYRIPGARRRKPERSHLASPGRQLLITPMGPLDLLGTIGYRQGYGDLIADTIELDIGHGLRAPVLKLEMLIKVKEATATEKDKVALQILRRLVGKE
jgi:hypothetical protein